MNRGNTAFVNPNVTGFVVEGGRFHDRTAGWDPIVLLPGQSNGVEVVGKFLRAPGDPVRWRLMQFPVHREHAVGECVAHVGLSPGRVLSHLAWLVGCGCARVRDRGRCSHYKAADPRVGELVLLARWLAAGNAAALAACMRTPGPAPAGENEAAR